MKIALFKVGDKVKLRDLETVDKVDRSTMTPEMRFDDVREISGIEPMSTITNYKIEGMGNYLYLEELLEKAECEDTREFQVGDRVRLNPKCKVGEYYNGIELLKCMKFDGYREIDVVDCTNSVGIKDNEDVRWWYDKDMLLKDYEETNTHQGNNSITLTRKDFKDAYMSVAMGIIDNPPKKLRDKFRSVMLLSLSAPIIGDMIAEKLFGKEDKEEE